MQLPYSAGKKKKKKQAQKKLMNKWKRTAEKIRMA